MLVNRKKFRIITFHSMRVGHTHIDIDQRFGAAATGLSRAQVLQTPDDFVTRLDMYMPRVKGRMCFFERYHASWDWDAFFAPLDIVLHGHAGKMSVHPLPC
jgi:hypothetical protein